MNNNLISQIEIHSKQTPNLTAIYRRRSIIISEKKKSSYSVFILVCLFFLFIKNSDLVVYYYLGTIILLILLGLFITIKETENNDLLEWESVSYKTVNSDINKISKKLILGGVKPRQVIWLLWAPEQKYDLIIMVLALMKIGVIISWSSPEQIGGVLNFVAKIEEISPELIIGKPFIINIIKFIKFITFGKLLKSISFFYPHNKILSNEIESTPEFNGCIVETFNPKITDVVIIGFTTGSTGNPKGVEITFNMLNTQAIGWKKILKDTKTTNSVVVTLHHAINFIFLDLATGISSVLPEGNILDQDSIDVNVMMNLVNQFKVNILTGSPILIKKISDKNYRMPTYVNKIISYGCELHLNFFDKIKDVFNHNSEGRLLSMYGATEGGPIAIFDGNDITNEIRQSYKDGNGICLGKTDSSIIEVYIRVVQDDDNSFFYSNNSTNPCLKGEICISGPGVSTKCTCDKDTNLTKINDSFGKIYHRTGDYGYYDKDGNLWIMGRISHVVKTKWGDIYPLQVEAIINTLNMPEVFATAFVGIPISDGSNFKSPYLVFRLFPCYMTISDETIFNVRNLLNNGKIIKDLDIELIVHEPEENWPVDPRHKSKIGRPEIACWVQKKILSTNNTVNLKKY